jgi:hypothetical protein
MKHRDSSSHQAIALLIVFSLMQFYVVFALAGPSPTNETATPLPVAPQAITARLTTRGNQTVTLNGNNASTGATIMSGATIETGDQVGASVYSGQLGIIDIAPNSKVMIEFSDGQLKVTVLQGCVIVRNKKGTYAQIVTDKGVAASNDSNQKQAAILDVCYPSGAPGPIVNQGAAANAGAGAGAAAAGGGLPTFALVAIILGGGTAIALPVVLLRGSNPSPSAP